jgi:hypothetical protein
MAAIALSRSALRSQVVRNLVGERAVDFFAYLTTEEDGEGGGIISRLIGIGAKLVGFASKLVFGVGRWLLRHAWDIILTATYAIAYFNWNQADEEIRRQMEAGAVQIAAAAGELLGVGSVWLVSIGLAGLASMKWPVLGGKVLLDLAEEGGDEIRGELYSFLTQVRTTLTRNFILGTMLTARQLHLFGLKPINEPLEPWSIAGYIEEKVESIDNQVIRAFVENFLEGAVDSIIEVGYVVSYSIEDFYRSQKMANRDALGPERGVKVTPDERKPDEFIVVTGPQEIAKQSLETTLNQHRFIHNRDLGQLVGQPIQDYIRSGIQLRKLTYVFKSKEGPPWIAPPGQDYIKEVSYTIPEVEMGLTWQELKRAGRPWLWGGCRATANLSNGRQMAVYGATTEEAEEKLRELATLTTLEIITLSVSQEKDRHHNLRKRPTRMYPAYAMLLVRRPNYDNQGIKDLSGQTYDEDLVRIDLWPEEEPPGMVSLL